MWGFLYDAYFNTSPGCAFKFFHFYTLRNAYNLMTGVDSIRRNVDYRLLFWRNNGKRLIENQSLIRAIQRYWIIFKTLTITGSFVRVDRLPVIKRPDRILETCSEPVYLIRIMPPPPSHVIYAYTFSPSNRKTLKSPCRKRCPEIILRLFYWHCFNLKRLFSPRALHPILWCCSGRFD